MIASFRQCLLLLLFYKLYSIQALSRFQQRISQYQNRRQNSQSTGRVDRHFKLKCPCSSSSSFSSSSTSTTALESCDSRNYRMPTGKNSRARKPAFYPDGFSVDDSFLKQPPKSPRVQIRVNSTARLRDLVRAGYRVRDFDVRGDTNVYSTSVHPAVEVYQICFRN